MLFDFARSLIHFVFGNTHGLGYFLIKLVYFSENGSLALCRRCLLLLKFYFVISKDQMTAHLYSVGLFHYLNQPGLKKHVDVLKQLFKIQRCYPDNEKIAINLLFAVNNYAVDQPVGDTPRILQWVDEIGKQYPYSYQVSSTVFHVLLVLAGKEADEFWPDICDRMESLQKRYPDDNELLRNYCSCFQKRIEKQTASELIYSIRKLENVSIRNHGNIDIANLYASAIVRYIATSRDEKRYSSIPEYLSKLDDLYQRYENEECIAYQYCNGFFKATTSRNDYTRQIESIYHQYQTSDRILDVFADSLKCWVEEVSYYGEVEKADPYLDILESVYARDGNNEIVAVHLARALNSLATFTDEAYISIRYVEKLCILSEKFSSQVEIAKKYVEAICHFGCNAKYWDTVKTIDWIEDLFLRAGDIEDIAKECAHQFSFLVHCLNGEDLERALDLMMTIETGRRGYEYPYGSYPYALGELISESDNPGLLLKLSNRLDKLHSMHPDNSTSLYYYASGLCKLINKHSICDATGTLEKLKACSEKHNDNTQVVMFYAIGLYRISLLQNDDHAYKTVAKLINLHYKCRKIKLFDEDNAYAVLLCKALRAYLQRKNVLLSSRFYSTLRSVIVRYKIDIQTL